MKACRALFDLALAVHIPRKRLFECMLADGSGSLADMDIGGGGGGGVVTASGESFIQTFKQELSEYFIRNSKHFVPMLFEAALNPLAVQMLHSVLNVASTMTTTNTRAYEAEDVRCRIDAISEFLTCAFPADGVVGGDARMVPLAAYESDTERYAMPTLVLMEW